MNFNDAEKDMLVYHSAFGKGRIVEMYPHNKTVKIAFENVNGNAVEKKITVDHIEKINSEKKETKPMAENDSQLDRVDFYISDDELDEQMVDGVFKVIPSNYTEQSCYSTVTKRLLTYLRRRYSSEGIATIKSYENDGVRMGVFLVPSKGVIVFGLNEESFDKEMLFSSYFEKIATKQMEVLKKYYLSRFLQSTNMCKIIDDSYKLMRFPLRFVMLFQNIDLSGYSNEELKKIQVHNRDILFKNFSSLFVGNEVFSNFEKYDCDFQTVSSDMYGSIIERVVPENATLISIAPPKKIKVKKCENPEFHPITGKEREFSALFLDDTQIKAINDTKPGHYLTLADPGTGKSVLLVSKAFRIQSIKNDNHVLITCYNSNLAEHHSIFASVSGMKTENLHIKTFHKLAKDIVEEVDPEFIRLHPVLEDDGFNLLVSRLEELMARGKVTTKLNAIFIDEVQLFEPKWIDICYKLLDREDNKDFFFEMYGDINQDVKSQRTKGKASWQNTKHIPSLQGRVRKLDKNYRNTEIIAGYIKCMINEFNDFLNKHNIPIDPETSCLSSQTMRKGSMRVKVLVAARNDIMQVIKIIRELVSKKKAEYNEIAIVYPAKGYSKYYSPLYRIESYFINNGIPYSRIHGEGKQKLYECDGVILSTIDSCLGLDFNYVILCGLHYWEVNYEKQIGKRSLDNAAILFEKNAVPYLSEVGKKLYSACSRAREGLFIVDDLNTDSPIKNILRPSTGERFFDEY